MKPLILKVFPRIWDTSCSWNHHWTYEHPYATEPVPQHRVEDMGRHKHLTIEECCAEYHQQRAYALEMVNRTTAAHDTTNWDRAETLHRFATHPHAGGQP